MKYYLQHFFNPDLHHLELRPTASGNRSDLYNLGYVQNVIAGQVLARVIPLTEAGPNPDPRFILPAPTLPAGSNTRIAPEKPTYLLSDANGYVFYCEGKITVKKLLNVRSDVSFKTGNIFFVGDLAVHGAVKAGFEAEANNVRIMGMVEGGVVRARRNLLVDYGCKGGAGGHCRIIAGGALQATFAEKAMLRCNGDIILGTYCFYCDIYGSGNLLVKGSLNGGRIQVYGSVVVGGQVGNAAGKPMQILLGYNPAIMRQLERDEKRIAELSGRITHQQAVAGHLPPDASPLSRKLADNIRHREFLIQHRDTLWAKLTLDEQHAGECRFIARGEVLPGVEIAIGRAFLLVERPCSNVMFFLENDEIVMKKLSS